MSISVRVSVVYMLLAFVASATAQSNTYSPLFVPSNLIVADSITQAVGEKILLEPDMALWAKLLKEKPNQVKIAVPAPDGATWHISLEAYEAVSKGFVVTMTENGKKQAVEVFPGLHYKGTFEDGRQAIVALSILDEEIMGVISFGTGGNYVLGRIGDAGKLHVLYNDATLMAKSGFVCGFKDTGRPAMEGHTAQAQGRGAAANCVTIYVEAGYRVYEEKGYSLSTTTQWVTGLFNVVSQVYANDQINVQMSELFVHTTTDPYYWYDLAENTLYDFANNNFTFNGDLAHYVTLDAPWTDAGGIAALDGLCNGWGYGTSNLDYTYSGLPTYSWSINVVTHELGHNLGSEHTHSCSWPGGPIDTCFTVEGNCYNGPDRPRTGTIMSYCHLNGGVNLNLGFGPLPSALIRNNINAATCLQQQITDPTSITTGSGSAVACPGQSLTLTVNGGNPGTGGRWAWYQGSCGGALVGTGRTLTVSPSANTQYFVRGEGCGYTGCLSINVVLGVNSVAPTSVYTISDTICSGTSAELTVVGGQLAPGANWEWFADVCGTGNPIATGGVINVAPTASTTYGVRASGGCGGNTCINLPIAVVATPVINITPNDTTVPPGTCVTLTANGNGNVFEWSNGDTGNSIEVCQTIADVYSYRVTVSDNGNCGISTNVKVTFAEPSAIGEINENAINIFPNPNTGSFAIDIALPALKVGITLMDMVGKEVYQSTTDVVNGQAMVNTNLSNGMYLVKVQADGQAAFKKLLITR